MHFLPYNTLFADRIFEFLSHYASNILMITGAGINSTSSIEIRFDKFCTAYDQKSAEWIQKARITVLYAEHLGKLVLRPGLPTFNAEPICEYLHRVSGNFIANSEFTAPEDCYTITIWVLTHWEPTKANIIGRRLPSIHFELVNMAATEREDREVKTRN